MARQASAKFLAALKTGHVVSSKVEVIRDGAVVLSTTGDEQFYVSDGEVTMDRSANYRRLLRLEVADVKRLYLPKNPTDYFHPLSGNEIKVYRGIKFADGSEEIFSQGVFDIEDCDIEDNIGSSKMNISGYDRSSKVSRSLLTRPYTIAQNTNTVTAIKDLITNAVGEVTFLETPTTHTTNFTRYEVETDPWDSVKSLAEAIGYEVYFNADGLCVIRPKPDPSSGEVSYYYREGSEAILGGLTKSLSKRGAHNGVFAYGQSTYNITPAFGEAWDTDPSSPTYSGYNPTTKTFVPTRYGRYPKFMDPNPNIKTNQQARDAAAAELLNLKGASENIQFTSVVNPIHEESDLVGIVRANSNVNAVYVLDSFTIPLVASQGMSARTRERRA